MEDVLTAFGICVIMPVLIVWLAMRAKTNKDNAQKEILIAALEKNPDLDISEFVKVQPRNKNTLKKERLLRKLVVCLICSLVGVGILVVMIIKIVSNQSGITYYNTDPLFAGSCILCVGIAFIIAFFIGKQGINEPRAVHSTCKERAECPQKLSACLVLWRCR